MVQVPLRPRKLPSTQSKDFASLHYLITYVPHALPPPWSQIQNTLSTKIKILKPTPIQNLPTQKSCPTHSIPHHKTTPTKSSSTPNLSQASNRTTHHPAHPQSPHLPPHSTNLSFHPFVCPSIYLSIYPSIYPQD